jgi:hypothetical protein
VFRVLVLTVAVLLALLLVRRALRVISVVVVPALIGAVLAAWLLLGPLKPSVDRSEFVWACERKVPAEFARGMRKDCGIFGPTGDATRGATGGGD